MNCRRYPQPPPPFTPAESAALHEIAMGMRAEAKRRAARLGLRSEIVDEAVRLVGEMLEEDEAEGGK